MQRKTASVLTVALAILLVAALILLPPLFKRGEEVEGPEESPPLGQLPTPDGETPSEAPEDQGEGQRIHAKIEAMSLHEKVCQMFIVLPDALTGEKDTVAADETLKAGLEKYPVGGLVLLQGNIKDEQQLITLIQNAQSYSQIGLFLTCDEEGGRVGRLKAALGAHEIGPMLDYKDQGEEVAFQNAVTLSKALKKYGLNMDLAPTADVLSNEENTVIGDRAYSDSYAQAAALIPSAIRGFQSENIVSVLKHFPGHGSTAEDSHDGSAFVHKTLEELRREDFLPFVSGIASGADMVMLGHLIVQEIDGETPAPLSQQIVTEILRKELGFDGVIITDALGMKALTSHYTTEEVALGALKAGVDILLVPESLEAAVQAIESAIDRGELTEERINESVYRILKVKAEKNIISLD